ncbi:MAG: hypothetical protein KH415_24190 [Clostridium sp.]|nr:hypothetical protein [Clostridium sp.]
MKITINELKDILDKHIKEGYGEYEITTLNNNGNFSNDIDVQIDKTYKQLDITAYSED